MKYYGVGKVKWQFYGLSNGPLRIELANVPKTVAGGLFRTVPRDRDRFADFNCQGHTKQAPCFGIFIAATSKLDAPCATNREKRRTFFSDLCCGKMRVLFRSSRVSRRNLPYNTNCSRPSWRLFWLVENSLMIKWRGGNILVQVQPPATRK